MTKFQRICVINTKISFAGKVWEIQRQRGWRRPPNVNCSVSNNTVPGIFIRAIKPLGDDQHGAMT